MSVIHVSEYLNVYSGEPGLEHQMLTVEDEGAASKPFSAETTYIRVHATGGSCIINIGEDATAIACDLPLADGETEYFTVKPGHRLAAMPAVKEVDDMNGIEAWFAILADPKKAQERLAQISAATKVAQATLEAVRAETRELEKGTAALAKREIDVSAREQAATVRAAQLATLENTLNENAADHQRREAAYTQETTAHAAALDKREADLAKRESTVTQTLDARTKALEARESAAKAMDVDLTKRENQLLRAEERYAERMARVRELAANETA